MSSPQQDLITNLDEHEWSAVWANTPRGDMKYWDRQPLYVLERLISIIRRPRGSVLTPERRAKFWE